AREDSVGESVVWNVCLGRLARGDRRDAGHTRSIAAGRLKLFFGPGLFSVGGRPNRGNGFRENEIGFVAPGAADMAENGGDVFILKTAHRGHHSLVAFLAVQNNPNEALFVAEHKLGADERFSQSGQTFTRNLVTCAAVELVLLSSL